MVGSFTEADDLVQEALLRAWRARDSFNEGDGEVGLRRWLYKIATNACLDHLRSSARKVVSYHSFAEVPWLEPYPDQLLDELAANDATPADVIADKETIALGYLALIQLLPPRQRAIFLLRETLGWSANETASFLGLSVAATNSALQRARETIERHGGLPPGEAVRPPTEDERAVLQAFIDVHQGTDPGAWASLLREDVRVTMPPHPLCYQGIASLAPLIAQAAEMGEWRLVPAWANRQPAAVSYLRRPNDGAFRAFKIDVLRVRDRQIQEITTFEGRFVPRFGLPAVLP
jgi:RNA polymerase sigma-70 factor (ECF subfamily)